LVKKLLLNNVFLPIGDLVTGNSLMRNLNALRSTQFDEKLIAQKLEKILTYATTHSNYYRNLRIDPQKDTFEWLKTFPVLNKHLLKQNESDILTTDKNKLIKHGSSGSTGIQSTVYWTKEEQSINRATQILWWEWAGYRLGDPVLQTGINPNRTLVKAVKDKLLDTYYLQAFAHSKEEAIKALKWASGKRNPVLAGYASSLYVLALYAIELGINVKFRTAVSWGDKLFDHYKTKIKEAFGVEVYETYGSAEGLMMAAQYDLAHMYVMSSNVFLEIVDNQGNEVPDGELGHVLVTNLNAYAMPLIRYKVGDLAIKMKKTDYPKNKKLDLPVLEKVIGRDTDLVKTKNGKYMVVHSFTGIFEHIPEIKQFCVIQENLEGITIQYIKGENFNTVILEKIERLIINNLNEDFKITFIEVSEILPTKSGKPQLIISRLK